MTPQPHVLARFDGDARLHADFRAACRVQFAADVAQGGAAVAAGDVPALRRSAHSLKSVLHTLGESDAARCAVRLDAQPAAAPLAQVAADWTRLRAALLALAGR